MEPYDNPLAVQPPAVMPVQAPTPEQVSDLSGQWKNWLANQDNRAALLQFGVSMMQPMGFGQTPTGHVGQAVGSVGELGSRREAMDLKRQEVDSKSDLRMSQAQLAEARAANAGVGAARQADRIGFERERLSLTQLLGEGRLENQRLGRLQQARTAYDNAMLLVPQDKRPPFEQWLETSGMGALTTPIGTGGRNTTPQATTTTGAPGETPVPQITPPQAPRDAGQRQRGQTYMTPMGPMIWEGTGWRRP